MTKSTKAVTMRLPDDVHKSLKLLCQYHESAQVKMVEAALYEYASKTLDASRSNGDLFGFRGRQDKQKLASMAALQKIEDARQKEI